MSKGHSSDTCIGPVLGSLVPTCLSQLELELDMADLKFLENSSNILFGLHKGCRVYSLQLNNESEFAQVGYEAGRFLASCKSSSRILLVVSFS